MHNVFPAHMHADVTNYITKSIVPNMKSISNFTIIFALIFATNGTFFLSLMDLMTIPKKNEPMFMNIFCLFHYDWFYCDYLLALFGVYYSEVVLKLFTPQYDISWFVDNLSKIIGFVSFPLFYFLLLALFYWVGTAKIARFRQALPGAFLPL